MDDDIEVLDLQPPNKPCNQRIDFLATPAKRRILYLWQDYAQNFPPEKADAIKMLLQELYSLSPEDTETYFEQLRQDERKRALKRKMRRMLRRKYKRKIHRAQKKKAYKLFAKLLRSGMRYAFYHNLPPLISIRLKHISDVLLEQLCELRDVEVPDRLTEDKLSLFLITISDWFAVALEHIFYLVYVKKNQALKEIAEAEKVKRALEEERRRELTAKDTMEFKPEIISTEIRIDDLDLEAENY